MKLRLVIGRAGTGKTKYCLGEISQRLKSNPEGPSLVMVLPEHATFQVERALASSAGIEGFTRAYVFGFRRLAHRILMETGGAIRPHITELGKRLVLSRILKEHQDKFKLFHKAAKQKNFGDTLAGLIQEFKSYALTPKTLAAVEEQFAGLPIGDKLHDLSLIYSDFDDFLKGNYTDPEDYLTLLAEKIPQSEILQNSEVYIDGFSWFNPQETAVVTSLLTNAASVTVTICLADADSDVHKDEASLFHRQWNTRRKLLDLARQLGAEIEEIELTDTWRFNRVSVLNHIEKQFFSFPPLMHTDNGQSLVIAEAANRRVEVEGIARDILRLCREGYRYRDIAILIRADESYADIVETVLSDFEIPYFSDRKRQIVHHPLAEILRSSLEVVTDRWSYEPLFRCFKTDFFAVTRDDVDMLENYVLEFGIRGSRWTNGQPWAFVRRLSLGEDEELSQGQKQYLEYINGIKEEIIRPLVAFEQQLKAATDIKAMTTALYNLLENLNVPQQLEIWADKAEDEGDLEQALEHRQLWDNVVQLFEQLVETSGNEQVALADYADILNDGLEGLKLSLIPPGLDYVTVSPLEDTSIANVRAVYLPGVNDGVLPRRGGIEGLLTDAEREQLVSYGVELSPGAKADVFAERFLVYTALTRSSEYLWVSYPLADEEGKGLSPSLVVKRLRDLVKIPLKALPIQPIIGSEEEYVSTPKNSISALAAVLRDYKKNQLISPLWWDVYNWAIQSSYRAFLQRAVAGLFHHNQVADLPTILASRLYPKHKKLRGSVTRFESFRACPFKHFAQYGLSLKERAVFRLKAPDMGQFLHAALKDFGDKMKAEGREWGSVGEAECTEIVEQIVENLAPKLQNEILLSTEQHKHLTGRLKRTVTRSVQRLIEFDRVSKFKPLAMEQSFGSGEHSLPPLVYVLPDETVLEVVGQIDRLDSVEYENKKYILVIDYKSGGAWLKLVDVYHGLRLQLLTYLLVASKAYEGSLPAGVLYYFLKNPSVSANIRLSEAEIQKKINAALKMPGWVLDQPEVVRLLDSAIEGYSEFLKVALKKDETFYASSLAYVKSPEEFEVLLGHAEKMIYETAQRIMQGDIKISPYVLNENTPCSFCNYKAVCQFDTLLPENNHRRLKVAEDTVLLKKMASEEGDDL